LAFAASLILIVLSILSVPAKIPAIARCTLPHSEI